MVTCFAVGLMVKALSPSALLIRAATAWTRAHKSQAATIPQGRGVLRRRLLQLHLPATPPVVMLYWLALARTSTSSLQSSGRARGSRRDDYSLIVNGYAAAAGEEAGGAAAVGELDKELVELEKKLVERTNKSSFTLL